MVKLRGSSFDSQEELEVEFTGDDLCPDDDDSEEDAELTYISKEKKIKL